MQAATEEWATRGSHAAEISNRIVRLLREYTGRGPTRARTTIDRDSVFVVLGETQTKAERTLVDRGQAESVLETRHRFQEAMRDDLIEAVETVMERKVIAFMGANHAYPDVAAEVFVLEPSSEFEVPRKGKATAPEKPD